MIKMVNKKTTKIQTLIFDRDIDRYSTKKKVKKWVESHDFKLQKNKKDPIKKYKKPNTYRVRQRSPSRFIKKSFRTIKITNGIKAVIGFLK